MAKIHQKIDQELKHWIEQQPLYFLASAPLEKHGHVNLSPRGLDSLRVIAPLEVIILDMTGSGNETAAHLLQNGRLTVMFCAFEDPPRILRLYGDGRVVRAPDPLWADYRAQFPLESPGIRQIFHLQISRVQSSCGFGVPLMNVLGQRSMLTDWADKRGPAGITNYQNEKNALSIDGLTAPGLPNPPSD